jgi:hypothetical protein
VLVPRAIHHRQDTVYYFFEGNKMYRRIPCVDQWCTPDNIAECDEHLKGLKKMVVFDTAIAREVAARSSQP